MAAIRWWIRVTHLVEIVSPNFFKYKFPTESIRREIFFYWLCLCFLHSQPIEITVNIIYQEN